ncbi:MAG TPA: MATE family efflux transporter [Longimicrobiales bacterium]|nr:MATE family efflux transporter [Longimicrobiales bacterium]
MRSPGRTAHPPRRPARLLLHELRALLALAGPIVASQLGHVGMSTADTIMVGPLGARPLAAVGVGSALHTFTTLVCTGVILGMAPLVSQAYGAGDLRRCRQVLVQGFWLALLLSLPVMYVSLLGEELTRALGQDRGVTVLAGGYMRALTAGIPPLFLFLVLRQYLEGMGRSKPAMVLTFGGLVLNVVANRIFIYGVPGWVPAMGVVGTGWATTLVRWAMLAGMLGWVLTHRELQPLRGVRVHVDRVLLATMARVGGPVGAQFGLEVGLFSFAAIMMGWLGPVELAAHQVTINIAATTFMVALGVSIAGSIRVGQHVGARRPRAIHRAAIATYLLAVGFMALCALAFVVAPAGLIGLYTDDPGILATGTSLLLVAAAFQVFDGAQVAGFSVLRGTADTRGPMLIAGVGYWALGVPVAYLLAFRTALGPVGVWIGLSAGLAAVALMLAIRVRQRLWRGRGALGIIEA